MTLNFRIFKLIGGLVTASSLAILITIWLAGTKQISNQVDKELSIAQGVIERIFDSRTRLLFSTADVLTADFGFKQAVATQDQSTIASVLNNHAQRISADLMVLLDLDGRTLASTSSRQAVDSQFTEALLVEKAKHEGGLVSMYSLDGRLYQIIMLTVDTPNPIAIAVVGFEINSSLIEDLKNITKLDVTITAQTKTGQKSIVSSLSEDELEAAISAKNELAKELNPFHYQPHNFVSHHFNMPNIALVNKEVEIILSEHQGYWFSRFYQLLRDIFLISAVSMALAILLGLIFSRNITRPLANLVDFAKLIASGQYRSKEERIKTVKTQEISRLEEAFFTMQEDIRTRQAEIEYQAKYDQLTDLFNRYHITEQLKNKLKSGLPFDVISFKVVGFREVNNAFGYDSGDTCLASLAERIKCLGGDAARLNGSEILWLPSEPIKLDKFQLLRDTLEEAHILNGLEIRLKLAVGHLVLPQDATSIEETYRNLSIAVQKAEDHPELYQAYQAGMEQEYLKRLTILRELEATLEVGMEEACELTMFYQPKLNLSSGQATKVEALIRWNSKVLGFVPPDLFIPIAEKAGLINELTQWVITRVIRDMTHLQAQGHSIVAAVNLSVHDLTHAPLISHIKSLLAEHDLDTSFIEFEVTESDLMDDPKKAISQLEALQEMGFALAIDDFGTGYSSMAYLKNMPVSTLKIDKSFVLKLNVNQDDQTIVQVIIDLAKRFHLELVAEGVENQETLDLLKQWGCDWIQGYFISKPIPPDALLSFLNSQQTSSEVN